MVQMVQKALRTDSAPSDPGTSNPSLVPLSQLSNEEAVQLLIQLDCCADLRQRVESMMSELDGEYLKYIRNANTLCSLEKPADLDLRMPHLEKVFNKLKKIQESGGVETTQYSTIRTAAAAATASVQKVLQSVKTPPAPNVALLLPTATSALLAFVTKLGGGGHLLS